MSLFRCPLSSLRHSVSPPRCWCPGSHSPCGPQPAGHLVTLFPRDASPVLVRGVPPVTGSRARQVSELGGQSSEPNVPVAPDGWHMAGCGEPARQPLAGGRTWAGPALLLAVVVRDSAVPRFLGGLLSHSFNGRHYIIFPRARAVFLRRALFSWFLRLE